jgi:hypothetical protein
MSEAVADETHADVPAGKLVSVCATCGAVDPTEGGRYCGAHTRQAESHPHCHNVAGHATDHVGAGRCKFHGGRKAISHGRYSKIERPRIRDLIADQEDDPDPLNILPELAAGRALFVDFIERYDAWLEALLAWHVSWEMGRRPLPPDLLQSMGNVIDDYEQAMFEAGGKDDELTQRQTEDIAAARKFIVYMRGGEAPSRPRQVLDLSDAMRHLDIITKMVERIEKIRAANAISRVDFFRLMNQMGNAVQKHVDDPEKLRKIGDEWRSLAV